jgi:hypothetical protein
MSIYIGLRIFIHIYLYSLEIFQLPYMTFLFLSFKFYQSTPVGSVIFNKLSAIDPDANVNGQIEYRILDDEGELEYDEDGVVEAPYFKIDLPHQGLITVARPLDYEAQKMHVIKIIASVNEITTI